MTPTFVLESDNEDDESAHGRPGSGIVDEPEVGEDVKTGETSPSQNERGRYWVEEEGEVFRKGQKLICVDEMEGDFDGEEIGQEVRPTTHVLGPNVRLTSFLQLLEAEVDRPQWRSIVDEFGVSICRRGAPTSGESTHVLRSSVTLRLFTQLLEAEVDRPPPRLIVDEFGDSIADTNSPLLMNPTPGTPTTTSSVVSDKPAPRPYIPRRRSSQASMIYVSSTGSTRSNGMVKS
jgi:hypothetical protein